MAIESRHPMHLLQEIPIPLYCADNIEKSNEINFLYVIFIFLRIIIQYFYICDYLSLIILYFKIRQSLLR
jgi:hypothetical protein